MAKKNLQYEVEVSGDISGLKKAMNDAVAEFKATEKALKNVQQAYNLDPSNTNFVSQINDLYRTAIQKATDSLKELKKQQKNIMNDPKYIEGVTNQTVAFTELEKEIARVTKERAKLQKEFKEFPSESQEKINQKYEKFKSTVKDVVDLTQQYKNLISTTDKEIALDPTNAELYAKRQEQVNSLLEIYKHNIEKASNAKKDFENAAGNSLKFYEQYDEVYTGLNKTISELSKEYEELQRQFQNTRSPQVQAIKASFDALSDSLTAISTKTQKLSLAFKGLLASAFDGAKSYETEIANIRRVAGDLTDEAVADLKELAIQTGNTFEQVSEYATISAALGLTGEEINTFTKAMLDLNAVSGNVFSGEEGAKQIAVFLKQLGLGIDEAENFGSAIAVIGDKYADIGDETVNLATKMTGLNSIISTNQYELLGLAGVMADLGLSTDSNANGINRAFMQINNAVTSGGEKLETLAKTSGMTAEQFKKEWGTNAVNAFLKFTDGLKTDTFQSINEAIDSSSDRVKEFSDVLGWSADTFKSKWKDNSTEVFELYIEKLSELDDESTVASQVLKDLGISSVNTAQTLLRLAGSGDEVREAIQLANKAWNENTALQEKSGILYQTTERKLQSFYESFRQLKASLIESILPSIKNIIDTMTSLSKTFAKMPPVLQKLTLAFVGLGATISPVTRHTATFIKSLGELIVPSEQTIKALSKISSGFNLLGSTAGGALGTIGLVVTGISLFAVAVAEASEKTQSFVANKNLKAMKDELEEIRTSLEKTNETISTNVKEWEYNQIAIKGQVEELEKLYETYKKGNLTEQESADAKERLKEKIDKLNKSLGENKFFFDEDKGAIVDEKGEIVDGLIPAYEDLFEARKRSYLLQEYEEAYLQSLKDEEDLIRKRSESMSELTDAVHKYREDSRFGDDFVDMVLQFESLEEIQKSSLNWTEAQYSAAAEILKAKYNQKVVEDEIQKGLQECTNIQERWAYLSELTGDELELALKSIDEGFNLDVQKMDLQEIEEALDRVNEEIRTQVATNGEVNEQLIARKKLLSDEHESRVAWLEEEKEKNAEYWSEENEAILQAAKNREDETFRLYNTKDGKIIMITNKGSEYMAEYLEKMQKRAHDNALAYGKQMADSLASYIQSLNPTMNVSLRATGLSQLGLSGYYAGSYYTENSRGFGDKMSSIMNSIQTSFNNMRSGGFNSRGMTVNANFTINNAQNLGNKQMAVKFARSFVNELNDALGMEI